MRKMLRRKMGLQGGVDWPEIFPSLNDVPVPVLHPTKRAGNVPDSNAKFSAQCCGIPSERFSRASGHNVSTSLCPPENLSTDLSAKWPQKACVLKKAMIVRIYLDEVPLKRARNREITFIDRVRSAIESQGVTVEYRLNTARERGLSAKRNGYSLFLMDEPFHSRALTMRRAYHIPYWRIEASSKRWQFKVANEEFYEDKIDPAQASSFSSVRRKSLFGITESQFPSEGYIYVPLQGRILVHRSFQLVSPISMVEKLSELEAERKIVIGLHPGEFYFPEERDALNEIIGRYPNVSISDKPAISLARYCEFIVTQNSSVALMGYYFHKPAVIFAKIDFHHIALSAMELGIESAITMATKVEPNFDQYMYWFFKIMAINAHSNGVEGKILERFREHGWTFD